MSGSPAIGFGFDYTSEKKKEILYQVTEKACKTAQLSHFDHVYIKNPNHSSPSDPRPHATVRMATKDQKARGVGQTVHIYYDSNTGVMNDYKLHPETKNKTSDFSQG